MTTMPKSTISVSGLDPQEQRSQRTGQTTVTRVTQDGGSTSRSALSKQRPVKSGEPPKKSLGSKGGASWSVVGGTSLRNSRSCPKLLRLIVVFMVFQHANALMMPHADNYLNCLSDFGQDLFRDMLIMHGEKRDSPEWTCCNDINKLNTSSDCLKPLEMSKVLAVTRIVEDDISGSDPDMKKMVIDNVYLCSSGLDLPGWSDSDRGDVVLCYTLFTYDHTYYDFSRAASGMCMDVYQVGAAAKLSPHDRMCNLLHKYQNETSGPKKDAVMRFFETYNFECLSEQNIRTIFESWVRCPTFGGYLNNVETTENPNLVRPLDVFLMEHNRTTRVWYKTKIDFVTTTYRTKSVAVKAYTDNPEKFFPSLCPDPNDIESCYVKGLDYFSVNYDVAINLYTQGMLPEDCLKRVNLVPRLKDDVGSCPKFRSLTRYPLTPDVGPFGTVLKRRHGTASLLFYNSELDMVEPMPGQRPFNEKYGNSYSWPTCTNTAAQCLNGTYIYYCGPCEKPSTVSTTRPTSETTVEGNRQNPVTNSGSRVRPFLVIAFLWLKSVLTDVVPLKMVHSFYKQYTPNFADAKYMKEQIVRTLNEKLEYKWVSSKCGNETEPCEEVMSGELQCAQVVKSGSSFTLFISDESVCDGRICSKATVRGLSEGDFSMGYPPDAIISVVDTNGDSALGVNSKGDCESTTKVFNVPIKMTGQCILDVRDTSKGLEFKVKSVRFSHLQYSMNGGPETKKWLNPGDEYTLTTSEDDDFSVTLRLTCNGHYIDEKFIINRREWCDRHSYIFLSSYYCKHSELLWWCMLFVAVGVILHFTGSLITDILSIIFMAGTFFGVKAVKALVGTLCENCGCRYSKLFEHKCCMSCCVCGELLASTMRENKHFKTCSKNNLWTRLGISVAEATRMTCNFKIVLKWLTDRSKILILIIVIFTLMDTIKAANVTLQSDLRLNLLELGAHDEGVPSNLFTIQSLAVVMTQKSETCDAGSCVVKGKISASVKAQAGNSFALKVKDLNGGTVTEDLYLVIEQSGIDYPYEPIYKACESTPIVGTDWECTSGCDTAVKEAKSNLCKLLGKPSCEGYVSQMEGASNWGCEPSGCAAIADGCISTACVERAKPETCYDVLETKQGRFWIKLCVFYLGKYDCLILKESETKASKGISMVLSTQEQSEGSRKLALSKAGQLYEGEMNGEGEFGQKFGYPQFDTNEPDVGNCGYGNKGPILVECGTHGKPYLQYCCDSTYNLHNHLRPRVDLKLIGNKLTKLNANAGVAIIEMELSGIASKTINIGKVTAFRMNSGKGCYNCDTGFTITASAVVSLRGRYPLSCGSTLITIDTVALNAGQNDFVFSSTSQSESSTMRCTLGGFEATSTFKLDRKHFSLDSSPERQAISLDSTHSNFLAWLDDIFDPFSWGIGSLLRKGAFLLIIVVVVLGGYYFVTIAVPMLKTLWKETRVETAKLEPTYKPIVLRPSKKRR